jgi:hypothetical protein
MSKQEQVHRKHSRHALADIVYRSMALNEWFVRLASQFP